MISYATYKLVHYCGLFLIFAGLGGVLFTHLNGGKLVGKTKVFAFSVHGLGMFFTLLGGFGMLARLGVTDGIPGWIYLKLVIWLLMGLGIAAARRKPGFITLILLALIGLVAPWAAMTKPFLN